MCTCVHMLVLVSALDEWTTIWQALVVQQQRMNCEVLHGMKQKIVISHNDSRYKALSSHSRIKRCSFLYEVNCLLPQK